VSFLSAALEAGVREDRGTRLFDDRSAHIDRFGLLLLVTAVSIVALSLVDLSAPSDFLAAGIGALMTTVLVGVTLLLALRASGLARRWRRIADVLVSVTIAAIVLVLILDLATDLDLPANDGGTQPFVLVFLAVLAPVVVVRRLLQHRRITNGTLLGAVSAYLLIPVAFYYAFITVAAYQTTPFFGSPEPSTSFMYFSLSSLTTVGYGDLAAVTPLGRLLATTEAVVGQVYLVTFVAMLVGLYAQRWRSEDRDRPA
jgi:hypothetical protein